MTYLREQTSILDYRNQQSPDGRLRISQQVLQGDYKQHNDIAGGSFNTQTIGTGSFAYENSAVGGTELQVTTTNDACIRQTYQWHNYFAGKPTKVELTASYFQPQTDVTKRMGYFSATTTTPFDANKDGMYFESSGGTIYCKVVRNGTEVYSLGQGSWLNTDELGGFDPTNFNFYVIDFLYLGGAVVNFWVLTQYGLTKVASYQHINVDQNTFIKSPNQPIRYEIRSTGGAGVFNHICSDVTTEGFQASIGNQKSINNGDDYLNLGAGNRYAALGVRQSLAFRNVTIQILNGSFISGGNDDLLVELYYGGSIAGTPTWNPVPFSYTEWYNADDLGTIADAIHTGGVLIDSLYIIGNGNQTKALNDARRIGSYIDGALEEAYICITPITAATALTSLNYLEFV